MSKTPNFFKTEKAAIAAHERYVKHLFPPRLYKIVFDSDGLHLFHGDNEIGLWDGLEPETQILDAKKLAWSHIEVHKVQNDAG